MMNARQQELLGRIRAFEFDEGRPGRTFAEDLAEENGWSPERARRAIAEYRRFLYLAVEAGHPVSPPWAVDRVWRLHLTWTRSYWDRLCAGVLGRRVHHVPDRGGDAERREFLERYAMTRDSYERAFGERPPAQFWPVDPERPMRGETRRSGAARRPARRPPRRRFVRRAIPATAVATASWFAGRWLRAAELNPTEIFALALLGGVALIFATMARLIVRGGGGPRANLPG